MSTGSRSTFSGVAAFTSSMSIPPSTENRTSGPLLTGSLRTAAYSSRAIGSACSTSTALTGNPLIGFPSRFAAACCACAGVSANWMAPGLAALTGGDLGLDDDPPAEGARDRGGLACITGHRTVGSDEPTLGEQAFALVLKKFHDSPSVGVEVVAPHLLLGRVRAAGITRATRVMFRKCR